MQHTLHDNDQSAQQRPNACAQGDDGHALDHRSADDEPEAGLVLPGDRLVAVAPLPCCPCQQCRHQESGDYAAEDGANRGRVCLRPWLVCLHVPRVWAVPNCSRHYPRTVANEQTSWQFADAWVFTAIAVHRDAGCDLSGLLAAGDAINHAILADDEVSQGIGRLEASGLVAVQDGHFSLTPEGQDLAARRKGGMFGQVRSVQALLKRKDLRDELWIVPAGALDAAYAAYSARHDPQ